MTYSYWYEPSDETLRDSKGDAGLLVSLIGPEDFPGERASKFMWDSFKEEYYYSESVPAQSMRRAVKSAQKRLIELIKNEEVVSEQGVDLHLCAFSFCGGNAYVAFMGNPSMVLFRRGKAISLSDMVPSYRGESYREEVSVGSFPMEEGDIALVSTPKLLESFLAVYEEDGYEKLSDWRQAGHELDLFSENMVGNQYIWAVGYGIEDTGSDVTGVDDAEGIDGQNAEVSDVETKSDGMQQGQLTGAEGTESAGAYTPRGITSRGGVESMPSGQVSPQGSLQGGTGPVQSVASGVLTAVSSKIPSLTSSPIVQKAKALLEKTKEKGFVSGIKRQVGASVSGLKIRTSTRQKMVLGKPAGGMLTSKRILGIGLILAVVFIGWYAWSQRQQRLEQEQIAAAFDSVSTLIEDATSAWEVQKNRQETEASLASATETLDGLDGDVLDEEQKSRVEDLRDGIQSVYDLINRVSAVSETDGTLEILADLYLKLGESADITDFEKYGEPLYIVDRASHAVYRFIPSDGVLEKIANSGDIMKSPRNIAIGDGYMYIYDSEVGVLTLDMNENEPDWTFRVRPELSARTVGSVTELSAFADNVYLLKADEARVLKSYPAGEGYSYPEEYFRHGAFDKAVDILIDGNIYVLSDGSEKLYRFFAGQQDTFSLSGFDVPLGNLCCGSTNLNDSGKLYVYDVENKRIVSIEKPTGERHPGVGVFMRQYVYRGEREDIFTEVKDIVVDIDERIVYVLDGTRILKVLLENE